ncbi:hypothetical protein Tco_1024143 [Tanacetum coccineum]
MFQTTVYLTHDAHRAIYYALQEFIQIDELQARYVLTHPSRKKPSHDDQDPPKNCEGRKMKRQKGAGQSSSIKDKALADSINFERFIDADEPRQEKRKKFIMMHLVESMLIGSSKQMRSLLNKDKIIKVDLEGPKFEVLKNMFDWKNPEGDRFHTYLSKPLPPEGPPSRKTIPTRYFFNKYLEYLMHGNEERNMLSHCQR